MVFNTQVSPAELQFHMQGIQQGVRQDGRSLLDLRHLDIKTGVFPLANGSARIRQPFNGTEILAGVKIEVGTPSPDKPDAGQLQVSIDCNSLSPVVNDNFAMDQLSAQLAQSLEKSIAGSLHLDSERFCIIPGKFCWIICIDIVVMGQSGNLSDLISLAAYCALRNSSIPEVNVVETEEGPDFEVVQDVASAKEIISEDVPLSVTLSLVNNEIVADLSAEEEQCATAAMTISINKHGKIHLVQKQGDGGLAPRLLPLMFQTAGQIAKALFGIVDKEMNEENEMQLKVLTDPKFTFVRDSVVLTKATTLQSLSSE